MGDHAAPRMIVRPRYRLIITPALPRVTVTMQGFWTLDVAKAFALDMVEAVTSLNDVEGQHTLLCDATECDVAASDVIGLLFQGMMSGSLCPMRARKIAIVTTSSLLRLQVDRLRAARPGLLVFSSRPDAEDWLRVPSAALADAPAIVASAA